MVAQILEVHFDQRGRPVGREVPPHGRSDRLAMGSRMFEVARVMTLASMPSGLSDPEIRIRLCERMYGDQVDIDAFVRRVSSR